MKCNCNAYSATGTLSMVRVSWSIALVKRLPIGMFVRCTLFLAREMTLPFISLAEPGWCGGARSVPPSTQRLFFSFYISLGIHFTPPLSRQVHAAPARSNLGPTTVYCQMPSWIGRNCFYDVQVFVCVFNETDERESPQKT